MFDTLIWLFNFPASHGFVMVFVAGFSLIGCFVLALRPTTPHNGLEAIREREGLPSLERPRSSSKLIGAVRRLFFTVLTVVMLGSLILGILGLTGVPVTRAYIHENGVPTVGSMDGDWVTFTTNLGVEYTLPNDFFSPSVYPDRDAYLDSTEPIVVRYLPDHPQAYVIESSQLPR